MSLIKKCLFPVAGYGTRFLPATKAMPKEMLPIVTKPLIQYAVEEAMAAGITGMAFVTGRGKRALEDHFDISYELKHQIAGSDKEKLLAETRNIIENCTFSYTRQVEMKGLGHAIEVGGNLIGDEPFAVILADDYCVAEDDSVLSQMVKLFNKYQCSIVAIEAVPQDETDRYGIIEGEEEAEGVFRISNMVEKPAAEDAPSNLAIVGRYILTPDIFEILHNTPPGKNGELQITDTLLTQAQQGQVIGYKFHGRRFDCGSVDGYIEAINYTYAQQRD
ncbi:MAG: UTP--glucose-1-phosphate uridylyltransferase GalU [Pseudomonadales bacterium]|jgi:UTP--glucose-1-phosphate uridylyltransferase|nr:UTP--glucose-1-phosphate uridylyltransferase GalU [Pseudomonadales bacterium]